MLGEYTQCDLDADKGKIDITELQKSLENSYFMIIAEIKGQLNKIVNLDLPSDIEDTKVAMDKAIQSVVSTAVSTGCKQLLLYCNRLAKLAELLDTIQHINKTDRDIEIVNRPVDNQE